MTELTQHDLHELTMDEVDEVEGGILPLAFIAGVAIGFNLGAWAGLLIRRLS